MLDFLSRAELQEITKRKQYTAQVRVLERMDIPYLPDGNGFPLVLRSNILSRFNISTLSKPKTTPDFTSAFPGMQKAG